MLNNIVMALFLIAPPLNSLAASPAENIFDLNKGVNSMVDRALLDSLNPASSPFFCESGLIYVPLPAFSAPNYSFIKIDTDGKPIRITEYWPTDTSLINKLLPNISTAVAVTNINGSINAGGIFGASTHREQITIDFMKYRSEPISSADGKAVMYARLGAGMRLQINITTSETNLGGSIMAIAASAKAGKTSGMISTDVIGIDANDVTLSMPFTSDLSEGSIQKIIEALAVVKSKLNDPSTTLVPQFIANIKCDQRQEIRN